MYMCVYIYIYICRVVVALENDVLIVINKDRNVAYDISLTHLNISQFQHSTE